MISVIVPVYKVERWLNVCLDSVLAQTCRDFELILVDDGSPDRCGEICDRYAALDPRVRVIHQENRGLSAARNAGTAIASGDYITYLDSDDAVQKNYLEVLLNLIRSCNADIAVLPFEAFTDSFPEKSRKQRKPAVTLTGHEACRRLLYRHERFMITAWGKLYSSSLKELLKYPEGRIHEDEFVTYKVMYKAERVVIGSEALYGYRQHSGSISSGYSENRLDRLDALSEAVQWFEDRNDPELTAGARKRYLLCLEIAWYNVHKKLPDRESLEHRLESLHKEYFREHKKEILRTADAMEKAEMIVFNVSPNAYTAAAGLLLKRTKIGE